MTWFTEVRENFLSWFFYLLCQLSLIRKEPTTAHPSVVKERNPLFHRYGPPHFFRDGISVYGEPVCLGFPTDCLIELFSVNSVDLHPVKYVQILSN